MKTFARMVLAVPGRKVLVVKNTKRGRWEFPGGKQDEGESLELTAIRETKEEVGVSVTSSQYVASRVITIDDVEWGGDFYYASHWEGKPVLSEFEKHSDIRWVTPEELADLPQIPAVCVDIVRWIENKVNICL